MKLTAKANEKWWQKEPILFLLGVLAENHQGAVLAVCSFQGRVSKNSPERFC